MSGKHSFRRPQNDPLAETASLCGQHHQSVRAAAQVGGRAHQTWFASMQAGISEGQMCH